MKALEEKLEGFISKYYKNELLKGLLFFIAIGLTYVLLVLVVEYFFWLNRWGRGLLFWSFVGIELALLMRFILIPLFRLFKLSKGIDYEKASLLIGNHFPEVRDKLINTLQLKSSSSTSDLLEASIVQKSKELEPVPFTLAIDYKANVKYIKYAAIPVLVFVAISLSKGSAFFSQSAERVLDYKTEYLPPAPFNFELISKHDRVIEGQSFDILTKVTGTKIPDEVRIELNGVEYFMKNQGSGVFAYTVTQPKEALNFKFSGNGFSSLNYKIPLVRTPVITSFEAVLNYPNYLGRAKEVVNNTGSFTIPEGTLISWNIVAENATRVEWVGDTVQNFEKHNGIFSFNNRVFNSQNYAIATSNNSLKRYEELNYRIEVIKDEYPEIDLEKRTDSIGGDQIYFKGTVSDDHGIHDLKLVYYTDNEEFNSKYESIPVTKSTVDQFYAVFPGKLELEQGKSYSFYFEVRDNDVLHGYKQTRSAVGNYNALSKEDAIENQLELQKNTIRELDKSVSKIQERQQDLEDIQNLQKQKSRLDFNDKKKLKSFIARQKAQKQMMKNYSETLKNSFDKMEMLNEEPSETADLLKKRLEKNEEQLKEQEKLMEEMEKLQEMMDDEELKERLDQMSKKSKNSARSMKQLLELTKRFFVQTKGERLGRQLEELGKEQTQQAAVNKTSDLDKQKELTKKFEQFKDDFKELKKENEDLKKPLDLPDEDELEEISDAQQKAEEQLKQEEESENQSQSKSSQKKAGQKMQKMGNQMKQSMASGGGGSTEQLSEDVEMLRQILDNLIVFSFDQEALKKSFSNLDNANPLFSKYLVRQNTLRDNFQHIDDSLFVLALRNPLLEEPINEELTEISYALDQTLERLADNDIPKGMASQQYVFKGANTLADMLSDILDNMQAQLSMQMGSGSGGTPMPFPKGGGGGSKQLSDIIMSQEELAKKLGDDGKKPGGKKDGNGEEGEEGKPGDSDKPGESGAGKSGSEGSNAGSEGREGEMPNAEKEAELARQYEIYKQQEDLRSRLEDLIKAGDVEVTDPRLLQQLDQIEEALLSGNSDAAKRRMEEVIQQFLKLEHAEQEKERKKERESATNRNVFKNETTNELPEIKKYFNSDELLNRDNLPLDNLYKLKVKQYFKSTHD